ncbi:hypothetical protein Tco_1041101 [Tanacetum coccineum]|uniref:Uncharacterized protein n=1 Tax=Tanacetum coccineum TaxID=301880 RepID=A0ABQ5GFW9_9ASTR
MRVRQRGELLFELERLGYSPEVYESVKLLKDLQEADMAKARSFMKVIRETELKEYEAKVVVRSKLKYFCLCKEKLNENRRNLFRNTCFGKWLDLSFFDHEPHLIDYILQKQVFVDDPHYEMPLIYNVEGHSLHFGRPEFSFITGLLFGSFSSRSFKSGDVPFVSRVLPHRLGLIVTNLDLLGVLENEQLSGKLADDDDVRVCLLLALEVIFRGRLLVDEVQDTLMRLVEKIEWFKTKCILVGGGFNNQTHPMVLRGEVGMVVAVVMVMIAVAWWWGAGCSNDDGGDVGTAGWLWQWR